MKKIKKYIGNITPSVKILVFLNLCIYLLFLLINYIFNQDLTYLFSVYPTCSENFDYYRIVTFMFSHTLDVTHIISNIVIFLLFAPFVSKKIGNKNTILLYFFSGITSFVFFNYQKNYENMMIKKDMIKIGININDIKQDRLGHVDFTNFKNCTEKQLIYLRSYPFTNSFLIGSSGSVFSFILLFLAFSIKDRKNIFLIVVSILLITKEIIFYFFRDITTSGTTFGHLGGIIGGLIFLLVFTLIIYKKRVV